MLNISNRLSSGFEINVARRHGNTANGQTFHMFYLIPRNYFGESKFAIVISNKFDKSAARRNRVKRVFREVIRHNLDKIKGGYWIVIHPKFHSIHKSYEEINTDFNKTLQTLPITK